MLIQLLLSNNLIYTVIVDNIGPSDASNVITTNTLPVGVTFVASIGCNEDPLGNSSCSLGNIVSGGSSQFTLEVAVDADTTGTISNTVSVSSDTNDNNSSNDSVTQQTSISLEADLSLVLIGPINPVTPGQIIFTIEVSNNGPSVATNVIVNDQFSGGTLINTMGCNEDPIGYENCTLGSISPGSMTSYTIAI